MKNQSVFFRTAAAVVLCTVLTGCRASSSLQEQTTGSQTAAVTEQSDTTGTVTEQSGTTASAPETTASSVPPQRYTFNPKVCSHYMEEVFGEKMCQAWFHLVDAILAGEDTFACPDQFTYEWMIGQFPHLCLPPVQNLIDCYPEEEAPIKDGVARFRYVVPKETVLQEIDRFGKKVEEILNEALRPDDTDFEKALVLYQYFTDNYTYDYALLSNTDANALSVCHVFYDKKGICQELSQAYSFLLMELGIDATVMSGDNHRWSYVRMNGKNYHIDPTYVLGTHDLAYFMMTDEQRNVAGEYPKKDFIVTSAYTQFYDHPDYTADDDTYAALWQTELVSVNRDQNTLTVQTADEDLNPVEKTFSFDGTELPAP